MKNKSVEIEKIEKAVTRWVSQKAMSEIFREKLGEIDEHSGNIHAEVILDKAIQKAKLEEKPEWSKFLFDNMKSQRIDTQINQQFNFGQDEFVLKNIINNNDESES